MVVTMDKQWEFEKEWQLVYHWAVMRVDLQAILREKEMDIEWEQLKAMKMAKWKGLLWVELMESMMVEKLVSLKE